MFNNITLGNNTINVDKITHIEWNTTSPYGDTCDRIHLDSAIRSCINIYAVDQRAALREKMQLRQVCVPAIAPQEIAEA